MHAGKGFQPPPSHLVVRKWSHAIRTQLNILGSLFSTLPCKQVWFKMAAFSCYELKFDIYIKKTNCNLTKPRRWKLVGKNVKLFSARKYEKELEKLAGIRTDEVLTHRRTPLPLHNWRTHWKHSQKLFLSQLDFNFESGWLVTRQTHWLHDFIRHHWQSVPVSHN